MKYLTALLSTLLIGQLAAFAEAQPGKPAPNFQVKDINGKPVSLADYKGKVVVLENYNPDCPFVVNQYEKGGMQKAQTEASQKGAVWLTVNSTYPDASRLKKELQKQGPKATAIVYDPEGKIGKSYGFKTTPHLFVIDKEGKVAYSGAIDDKPDTDHDPKKARNYVLEAIEKIQAGQQVAVASTKPYGCGAKYAK